MPKESTPNSDPQGRHPSDFMTRPNTPFNEGEGTEIGPFRLLEKIGEGGFGVVWVAEQRQPVKRRVALKIIKVGMDTKQVVARFEMERQALAMMDHPNIAQVLDGGSTESGRPYFCMELVKGIPITEYCDENNLAPRDRLELFIHVCHAVQHAHQKGIIHRDIKPSNILVTLHDGLPIPKVIDFGIAKATQQELTEKTVYTQMHQFLGTPAYMSPEQVAMSGLDIDTRTDVYSLGVLLYELLTGRTPFPSEELVQSGLDGMRKTIREKEPPRPSTMLRTLPPGERMTTAKRRAAGAPELIRLLRGDLDWIVIKALEKDRTRRYETANGLAADIKRHLENEAVVARPPSTTYRFHKAWRRNKGLFSAVGVVLLTLCLGISFSTWQAMVAHRARQNAEAAQESEKRQRMAAENARQAAVSAEESARNEARRAQLNAYISDMNLASRAWEAGNLSRAHELLSRYIPEHGKPDLRRWEWRLLWGLTHEDHTITEFNDGTGEVRSVALSADGRYLAWSGRAGVHIADLKAPRRQPTLLEDLSDVAPVAFSPDGDRLAGGNREGIIALWRVETGALEAMLEEHDAAVTHLSFHPDGTRMISADSNHDSRIWNLEQLEKPALLNLQSLLPARHFYLSPAASLAATHGELDNTVDFWQLETEDSPPRLLGSLPPQKAIILNVQFPSEARSAFVATHDSLVKQWDLTTLNRQETYQERTHIFHTATSADGRILATAGMDNLVKLWDTASGRELRILRGHTATITDLAMSADGSVLVSVDMDNRIKVWPTDPAKDKTLLRQKGIVVFINVSPDGSWLTTSDPNFREVRLWDRKSRSSIPIVRDAKAEVVFSPDGRWLAIYKFESSIEIWDLTTMNLLDRTQSPESKVAELDSHFAVGDIVNFSPNGESLIYRTATDAFGIWDTAMQKTVGILPDESSYFCATAFSPSGGLVATASNDRIRLWRTGTWNLLYTLAGQHDEIRSLCFSPHGDMLVAASGNTEVRRWDISDPTQPKPLSPLRGHTAYVSRVAFSKDGKTLATISRDSTLRLWDAELGQQVAVLGGHAAVPESLSWSPDGQTIFTGRADGIVRLWKAPSLEEIDSESSRRSFPEGPPASD